MLENGENREIIFIFPFKNLKTEEKNNTQIRKQLWTEMAGYKNTQKARRMLYITHFCCLFLMLCASS